MGALLQMGGAPQRLDDRQAKAVSKAIKGLKVRPFTSLSLCPSVLRSHIHGCLHSPEHACM